MNAKQAKTADLCVVCGELTRSGSRFVWRGGYVHSTGRCRAEYDQMLRQRQPALPGFDQPREYHP